MIFNTSYRIVIVKRKYIFKVGDAATLRDLSIHVQYTQSESSRP